MRMRFWRVLLFCGAAGVWCACASAAVGTFRVATYNLESYLDLPTETRPAKTAQSKARIRECILAARPDILAVQEMGTTNALHELRESLKQEGLEFPYWLHVPGADTNIFVAVLSRFPFVRVQLYTNEHFLLGGRRFRTSRGMAEIEMAPAPDYRFTLLTAHLKSKRAVGLADEQELRLEEARLLREKIDARLAAEPDANLLVLGDFNDTKDSASTKAVIGRGRTKLTDTRPAERNGDEVCPPIRNETRDVCWTHFYGKEDSYSRVDFILLSRGMAREWVTNETYIPVVPGWGLASDHRLIFATFEASEK